MGSLSTKLKKFYRKSGNKIVFRKKVSLNRLSLLMWERLGHKNSDSSTLSKVINGKRLFTLSQLKAFSEVLELNPSEVDELNFSFYEDYLNRTQLDISTLLKPVIRTDLDFIRALIQKCSFYLNIGNCGEVLSLTNIINNYLKAYSMKIANSSVQREIIGLMAEGLYLEGRAIGSLSKSSSILNYSMPLINSLLNYGKSLGQQLFTTYAYILLANTYYVAGNYSLYNKTVYLHSINYAKKALSLISADDQNRLFATRTLIASSIYLRSSELFEDLKKTALKKLDQIEQSNYVNGIHLYNTIAKGDAYFKTGDPLEVKSTATDHFKRTLFGHKIYEVSDIRNTLEIYKYSKFKNKKIIKNYIDRSFSICKEEGYERHLNSIQKVAKNLNLGV